MTRQGSRCRWRCSTFHGWCSCLSERTGQTGPAWKHKQQEKCGISPSASNMIQRCWCMKRRTCGWIWMIDPMKITDLSYFFVWKYVGLTSCFCMKSRRSCNFPQIWWRATRVICGDLRASNCWVEPSRTWHYDLCDLWFGWWFQEHCKHFPH